jgi:quinol monooxygenase YgiN
MIIVRFKVRVRPERADEASAAFAAVVPASRALDGVIHFDVARDLTDPAVIVATEVFADAAARERQEAQTEVAHVMALLPDILAEPPEATVYDVSSAADALAV